MKAGWKRGRLLAAATVAGLAWGCGIAVQKDLNRTAPNLIVYDDLCGLQGYYDTLELKKAKPPAVVSANEMERVEGSRQAGGRTRFLFEGPTQLGTLRRVLSENWSRVPQEVMTAPRVELEVHWAEKAGTKRVVTETDAELSVGEQSWALPYQVCLSELLFGERNYHTRREIVGLPPLDVPPPVAAPKLFARTVGDAGAPGGPDAGPRSDARW